MKIGITGKGGAGKSTLVVLLARDHVFSAYEADPLGGLRALHPGAEGYEGIAAEPCLIEFPVLEQGFRQLAREPEIKVVLMTTPHLHALEEARGIIETLRKYCPNEVLGVVVNQSGRKTAEKVAARLNLKLLGFLPQEPRLDDCLVNGDLREYRLSKRMKKALDALAANLGLKKRAEKKKGFEFFGRLKKWAT
jgi:CO dehydrogenase nickel-insertion accessory protein CooC1